MAAWLAGLLLITLIDMARENRKSYGERQQWYLKLQSERVRKDSDKFPAAANW
jgi:hypothetical protein